MPDESPGTLTPATMRAPQPNPSPTLLGRLTTLYREQFADVRRERLFLASLSFLLAFAVVRLVTNAIRRQVGPFHNVSLGGHHIHHLVWGILLLLFTGYLLLLLRDTDHPNHRVQSRLAALTFGIGAALTLDEFALWLTLEDVYWSPQGQVSVQAAIAFGGLLLTWFWAMPLLRAIVREWKYLWRGAVRLEHAALDHLHHHAPVDHLKDSQ